MKVDQQRHGYVGGHQLLATSTSLDPQDQGVVDRLSDIGGQPGPNESVPEYLTGYPLPSGRFYAFARTWYDESAPRAGCVLTHTLLVPADDWAAMRSLQPLAFSHEWFPRERTVRSLPQIQLPSLDRQPYPTAHAKGLAELCEAVFLEERRPIVWLTEPDDMTVLRLVEALWPALRGRFAFQTYALKPRSKAQGLFDLMVAPRSARGRFSAWEGRRIDGDAPARHAFTPLLVDSIFKSPLPDLEPVDPLGVLIRDQVGDPAKLRLSILWNNLRATSADPNTMLGMLDVLSAAALPRKNRWKLAKPLFESIFDIACSRGRRAGNIVEIALGKLDPGDGERLASSVSRSVKCLMETEPEVALRLAGSSWRDPSVVPIAQQAVAEGLAGLAVGQAWDLLRPASRALVGELISREQSLIPFLAGHRSADPEDWSWFATLLRELDGATFESVRVELLDQIRTGAQAPLLTKLLENTDPKQLSQALRQLNGSGALRDTILLEAFADLKGVTPTEKLDAVVQGHLASAQMQPLYEVLLKPKPWAVDWLLEASLPMRLRVHLLTDLLTRMSRSDRAAVESQDQGQFDFIVALLLKTDVGQRLAADLIMETPRLSEASFELALAHFGKQRTELARSILTSLIERLTPLRSETDAERLERALSTPLSPSALQSIAPSIVDLLIPARANDLELTYSLGFLVAAKLPDFFRRDIIENLQLITARAADYRAYRLSAQAYMCWAQLLAEAVSTKAQAAAVAADGAMEYVMRREFEAALPLVQVSFPAVFRKTFGPSKKAHKKAEELTIKVLRVFIRNRWDGVMFLMMLMETAQPQFTFGVSIGYSYESRRYIEEASRRFEAHVVGRGGPQEQEAQRRAGDELDFL